MQQKRRLGLLALLALGGRQGLSRDRLQAFLWPESSAARARHALDQTVYAIRHALGNDSILSTGQELRLNPEFVQADVWEFEEAIRAAQWAAAVGRYKGPLLDGFYFADSHGLESWIETERARLQLEYQTALQFLANLAEHAGDHSQAVTWWRRLANSDPLAAGPTKKLILALAAAGDRAAAVKQARHYHELVRRELEIEPDFEIERLARNFSHPPTTDAVGTGTQSVPSAIASSPPSDTPTSVLQGGLRETGLGDPSSRTPRLTKRSRMAAVAFVSALAGLLIGAVMVENRQRRDPRPGPAENASHRGSRISLPEARASYLRGLKAWSDRSKEGLDTAVVYFRRATELDPEYAEAYAGLANAYVLLGYFGYRPGVAMFPKAKAAALRSMQVDSTLASAHAALAYELIWERDFTGAESEFRKAIAFDPTYATAHQWYAILLMILGRVSESIEKITRAADLDPLSLQIQNNYGAFLNNAGEYLAALRQFQKVVGEEPDSAWVSRNPWVFANMSRVYANNGQYARGIRTVERALQIVPRHPRALYDLAVIYNQMGRRDLARQAFAHADTSNENYAPYRGMLYAAEGKADSAFLWFDRVERWGIQSMVSLRADPNLHPVRTDPRYRDLLTGLGILTPGPGPSPPAAR
ncbi:MAG TPA: tetratricopeptide repeat protein [Gemmatimonadaceae bacterium]|nr:tetratricopeptide repeat protein [Gemmatimonadaceae bacterium]